MEDIWGFGLGLLIGGHGLELEEKVIKKKTHPFSQVTQEKLDQPTISRVSP